MARRTWWKVGALLAAMMVFLTMLPVTALAAEGAPGSLYVAGQQITDEGYYTQSGGNWTKSGDASTPPSAPYFHYTKGNDNTPATLTLSGATIQGGTSTGSVPYGAGIYAQCKDSESVSLTIELIGNNTITGYYGIYVNAEISENSNGTDASLTITGENNVSLEVSGSFYGIFVKSGTGNASVTIENASVDAKTTQTNSGYAGVCVQSGASSKDSPNLSLAVNGGSLTTSGSASGDGIQFVVGAHVATRATTSLTVTDNAIVDARNGGISASRTSVTLPTPTPTGNNSSGIVFDDKNGTVYGEVTLDESLTINQGETLTIPEGSTLTVPEGKILTNNGTVTTTGSGSLTNSGTINNSGTLPDNIQGSAPPKITTPSLSEGTVNAAYSQTLAATGESITWSVASGSTLPGGLNLEKDTITGTPTTAGDSTFIVTATNTNGSDSKEYTLTINPAPVLVTGISLNNSNLSLYTGKTATLTATVTPENATNKAVTWKSSDDTIATVDNNGKVTAVKEGTATITVTTEDGNKTATCAVTVAAATVPVTGVTLNKTSTSLYVGDTETLTATVEPSDATNKNVTWSSDNTSVATVDADGKVTAAGAGTATITVATADGNKTATCVVTVTYPYVPPRPTGPDWGDVADDISDAEPGSTVKVDMDGKTVLPGEVLDELAGSDVTLALDMGDGLFWEIYGGDVPADAEYDDVDLGVALGGDDIPADVVNLVTGESGSVQVSLEHDGSFGFELTLVAPLGEDAAGLVANLYRFDDEARSLGYEATAQVDGEGVARLPFDHASSWLVSLDSRSHALPFPDALEGEWYSEAVRWAWLSGAMTGYDAGPSAGLFGTGDALTRAQLASALYKAAGEPEADPAGAAAFVDCSAGAWYAEAVAWVASQGLMTGYGDGTGRFGPEDELTREQLAAVFWRAAGEPAADADLSVFPDGDSTSAWALEPVEWAVEAGLLKGYDDTGELGPADPLERAQLAAVLMRVAQAAA